MATAITFLINKGLGDKLPDVLQEWYAITIPAYIFLYVYINSLEDIFKTKKGEDLIIKTRKWLLINLGLIGLLISGLIGPKFLVAWRIFLFWVVIPLWINVCIPLILFSKYVLYVIEMSWKRYKEK